MTHPLTQDTLITTIRQVWGPLGAPLITACQRLMQEWVSAPDSTPSQANLGEPYRDPEHGFLLLAHVVKQGMYRAPHDHGKGWVIYAVQHGEMHLSTYAKVEPQTQLVHMSSDTLRAGECRVYLPGDIHDTRCISESAVLWRLTSCDVSQELESGRMTVYPDHALRHAGGQR